MKKLVNILIAMIIIFSFISSVNAKDNNSIICPEINNFAKVVMELRQIGVPLIKVMNKFESIKTNTENQELNQTLVKILKTIMKNAYSQPRFMTKEYQQRAIIEFANKWYLQCLKGTSDEN